MKGYKAFEKGMICKGKQYAENAVFEEEKAEPCVSGMHFCKNPIEKSVDDKFGTVVLLRNRTAGSPERRAKQ